MKYLQSYKMFEGKVKSDDLINIHELCNNHLAYLLDDGFLVNTKGINTIYINITKPYIRDHEDNIIDKPTFKWNDIKYDVIPLLLLLKDKIDIVSFWSKSDDFNKSYKEYYSGDSEFNSILDGDNIKDSDNITSIEIELGDKISESKVFESKSNIKFIKKEKKKDAKTDTYDVSKSGTVIGQVKWSSRMRGYAFVPTTDCDNEIKEFVKELMRKRREDKK
jgi:hypothetical protein